MTVRMPVPVPGARFVLEFAAARLPTPADRRRYQAEFVADLYGEPALVPLRRAVGVLSRTHALHAAFSDGRSGTRGPGSALTTASATRRARGAARTGRVRRPGCPAARCEMTGGGGAIG